MKMSPMMIVSLCLVLAVHAKTVPDKEKGSCEKDGKKYRVGEKFPAPVGECALYTCEGSNRFSGVSCGVMHVRAESRCKITDVNLKLQFPKCCPRVVCS